MKSTFERLISEFGSSVEYASYCASTLPAKVLGIEYVGEIAIGKSANFVELDQNSKEVINTYCF
jgi:N-acetylglucosamine-6-phosphate deacetylase